MAKEKISELDAAATLDGTELVPVVQDGETVQTTAQDIADLAAAPYLKYVALLTQSGTDAPVATVLENTLGGTVVWSYSGVGVYIATLAGAFTLNKTIAFTSATGGFMQVDYTSVNACTLTSYGSSGSPEDEYLFPAASIEIRVYP